MSHVLLADYLDHLATADREGALDVALTVAAEGAGLLDVVDRLLVPAQAEVGRRWECNEWSVPQEHVATAISDWVLGAVAERYPVDPNAERKGRLVAVCAEGEWHSLSIRVLAEVVRRGGWDVTLLGASVPTGQLARFLHDDGPDGLLLSCSIPFNLTGARRVIEEVRATGTPVMAGGRAFGPDGQRATVLGADAWAPTAGSAVERLDGWHPFTTPVPPLTHPGFGEHLVIERTRHNLVESAVQELIVRYPAMSSYDEAQTDRTVEDIDYLFRFLSSSLLADDPELMVDYVHWLEVVLTSRGVPREAVPAGLEAAAEVTGLPVATALLHNAADRWRHPV